MRKLSGNTRGLSVFVLAAFLFSVVFMPLMPQSGQVLAASEESIISSEEREIGGGGSGGGSGSGVFPIIGRPKETYTVDDFVGEDSGHMIVYPRFGTPTFIEPGQEFVAEVAHDSTLGLTGWSAWLENEYRIWDCGVGPVTYGEGNIYLGMRTGYKITIYTPRDVSPELLNLVIVHESGVVLQAPMSVSVVPKLNANFYAVGITDTHLAYYGKNEDAGVADAKGLEMLSKMLEIAGARFLSHTGDISTAGHIGRREAIRQYIIPAAGINGGKVPYIQAEGNHEYDLWVHPKADNNDGDLAGDNSREDMDRVFGMRSQIIKMGSLAVAKHGYGSYWGDDELRYYMSKAWNELTGITFRVLTQHTEYHAQTTPMFQSADPPHTPRPSPNPNLMLIGHHHQLRFLQKSPYVILEQGGNPWEYAEGVPINFNYNESTNTWTCPQTSASSVTEFKFAHSVRKGSERGKIRETFTKDNDGTQTTNTATVENDLNMNFFDGRVRFIMAPGYYAVTGGEVVSQYPSYDDSKQIVLARVNIPANGSVSVSIAPSTPPEATPTPTPFPEPPTPAPTTPPTPPPVYTGPGDNAVPNGEFEEDFTVGTLRRFPETSTYTIGTWPGSNPARLQNNSRAIQIDIGNLWRDKGGHHIEIPLKDGFRFDVGKKYGVYFWAYSENADSNRNAAIDVKWHENHSAGEGRYCKTSIVSDLSDANGWKINGIGGNGEIWDFNVLNNGSAVRPEEISRMRPVVRLYSHHNGGTTSQPGKDLKCFDNIYITEIDSPPHIYEVTTDLEGQAIKAINVHLKYPIKKEVFTGSGVTVSGGSGNVAVSNVELADWRTIRVTFAQPLSPGSYSVHLDENDVKDLWGREFTDGMTLSFTEEGGTSEPPPTPTHPPEDSLALKNIWPRNNEKRVYIKPTINLQFGQEVVLPAPSSGSVKINGDTSLIESVKPDPDDASRFSVVLRKLQPFTTYTVEVNGIQTTEGVPVKPATSTFTTGEDKENLFSNHGFEIKADGFDTLKNVITSESPRSGAYSVKTNNADGENWMIKWGGYQIGKTYGFTAYFKVTPVSPAETGGVRVEMRRVFGEGAGNVDAVIDSLSGITKTEYKRIGGKVTIEPHPTNSNAPLSAVVWKFPPLEGTKYFLDDFEVYEIPETLGITEDGTVYEGAELGEGEPIVIAFNRDMEQDLSASAIKIDGEQVASVVPHELSARRFVVTPARPLSAGAHTMTISGAMDVYYNPDNPATIPGSEYNGSFTFNVEAAPARYEFESFRLYDGDVDITGGELPASAAVRAAVTNIRNMSGENGGAALVMALYRDGKPYSISLANAQIASGATEPLIEATINTPAMDDGAEYTLKAFLWENLLSTRPIHSLILRMA